ncbi:hypothetical protein BDB00DRAFT_497315 [Zychaea mexicana]|uniref:uncharacterized protein n=1 Tax=Zychaea mexicana TaxID=64656 RepID=UPI0022FF1ECC|nr:uncharacterized protein BDB00DRAFT_497315 [Zychaea mexicana]KAI9498072.1 hypothetical protein BDB00DRAFT_497315 [Zychaea mexicana]
MCCCRYVGPLINKYPLPLVNSTHPSLFFIAADKVNRFVCFCAVLRSFKAAFKIHWDDQKNNTTNDDFFQRLTLLRVIRCSIYYLVHSPSHCAFRVRSQLAKSLRRNAHSFRFREKLLERSRFDTRVTLSLSKKGRSALRSSLLDFCILLIYVRYACR